MESSKRQLRQELLKADKKKPVQPASCQMSSCTQCQARGFLLSTSGAVVTASVCACVKQCAACLGSGLLSRENGALPCHQPRPQDIVSAMNEAHIPARYLEANLDGFTNFSGNGSEIVQTMRKWLATGASTGILLSGAVGVGKTYLLASLAKELAMKGRRVKFVDFFQLLSDLKAGYSRDESEHGLLDPLLRTDVLFIDEMGKGRNTDWEITILDQLVMGRYNQNRPIVASTNCLLKEKKAQYFAYNVNLEKENNQRSSFAPESFESLESRVGKRIFSRLTEICTPLELTGEDFRSLASRPAGPGTQPRHS